MKNKAYAREVLQNHGVILDQDFHRLDSSMVERILEAAKSYGYRPSPHKNGSKARAFYEYANR